MKNKQTNLLLLMMMSFNVGDMSVLLQMERRSKSQLQNLKDRLEQADSTNRSLQNYVHFLKTSYGNVFGDSLLTS